MGVYIVLVLLYNVEDYLIIVSITLIGVFALIGMKMFKPNDNRKTAKREVQDTAQKEVIASKDITITTLKDELRSVMGKLTRLRDKEPEYDEELTESGQKPVTWEEITTLVNTQMPKYAKLLPLVKKQVMDATKGMSMEEILNYVKQFTGNQQSEGNPLTPDASGNTWRPDYA